MKLGTTTGDRSRNPEREVFSRTLIYLPVIHTQTDMGALSQAITHLTLQKLGRSGLSRKAKAIEELWVGIERVLDSLSLDYGRVRLYQDGLPVCDREPEIVAELARAGSRNHQLLLRLMAKGAVLMGTESGDLLVQEYELAKHFLRSRAPSGIAAHRKALSDSLLHRRDQFIAQRINETLAKGEIGILFLGMLHSVERYLNKDIKVIYPLHQPP